MVSSTAKTVEQYLSELPEDKRADIQKVVEVVRQNLPEGYEEVMSWGMICYQVPLSVYPDTYNKKPLVYAGIAAQKNHNAIYLTNVYGLDGLREKFEEDYAQSGKKLHMGKSCVRFKKLDDLPLDVIGKYIAKTPMEDFVRFSKEFRASQKSK